MKKLFYVETKNRHEQVLFFTSYDEAFTWLKMSTKWNEEKIKENIITTHKTYNNYFNFFPKHIIKGDLQ
jgi:hypothetical protein